MVVVAEVVVVVVVVVVVMMMTMMVVMDVCKGMTMIIIFIVFVVTRYPISHFAPISDVLSSVFFCHWLRTSPKERGDQEARCKFSSRDRFERLHGDQYLPAVCTRQLCLWCEEVLIVDQVLQANPQRGWSQLCGLCKLLV